MELENNFYVYCLKDPETNIIFYIGKGKNKRCKCHLKPSLWNNPLNTTNPFLYFKIQSIMKKNMTPIIELVKVNLTEEEALNYELHLIKLYKRKFDINEENGILFNIIGNIGCMTKRHVEWSEERKVKHKIYSKEKRKYDPSYNSLYNDYICLKKTRKQIAKENNCSEVLVKKRLQELNIKKPSEIQYPPKQYKTCLICKISFSMPNKTKKTYCSRKCFNLSRKK